MNTAGLVSLLTDMAVVTLCFTVERIQLCRDSNIKQCLTFH